MVGESRLVSRAEQLFADRLVERERVDEQDLARLKAEHPELAAEFDLLQRQWQLFDSAAALRAASSGVAPLAGGAAALNSRAAPGVRVGRFELLSLLGRGGMGEVWEAREQGLNRRVALKLLPRGVDTSPEELARFRREAEAASSIAHAGIVAVYSAGEVEGQLYLALELVEGGRSLRTWIDARVRAAELPAQHDREVAELFASMAEAMAAAHEHGTIHRDLKPQNILLAPDDRPKVADFGLAKTANALALSRRGAFLGTWYYASPEQARGAHDEVDARSDVFSLGVTLYECLTLRRPFAGDTAEQVLAQILRDEPVDPRVVRSKCPRDLAVIALKALEKEPARRYASMGALAADLRRHLTHQPILAREPSPLERTTKWARRHPTASTAIALSSVAFACVTWLLVRSEGLRKDTERAQSRERSTNQSLVVANADLEVARRESDGNAVRAREQATLAQGENQVREQVINFLSEIFDAADPEVSGDEDPPASKLLATAAEKLLVERKLDLRVRAALLETMALVFQKRGRWTEARDFLLEAVDLSGGPDGERTRNAENSRAHLALVWSQLGEHELARSLISAVIEREAEDPALACEDLSDRFCALAQVELEAGRFADAEATLIRAQAYVELASEGEYGARLNLVETRALLYTATGRLAQAESDMRAIAAQYESTLGPNNPRTIGQWNGIAVACRDTGRLAEAEAIFDDCLRRIERSLEPDHPNCLIVRANLAVLWMRTERAEKARDLLEAAVRLRTARVGPADPLRLLLLNSLGSSHFGLQRFDAAEPILREALEGRAALLGSDHPQTHESRNNLAYALYNQGKYEEALALQEETVARTPPDAYQRAGRERLLESIRQALVDSGAAR